jgi:hypothetical protein
MKWYVSGPAILFLAAAVISLRRALIGPISVWPRVLAAAVILLAAAIALVVLDLTT